jgi:23S rRNA (adenine2503-C2)-methyltransferase
MILKDTIKSSIDNTRKFIFVNNNRQVMEIAYIDHADDKDSLCVPTQSACSMACKFCHTTDVLGKIKAANLWSGEIVEGVETAYKELGLAGRPRTLLVSFMGCGEPLENDFEVLQTMRALTSSFSGRVPLIRFGMATLMPRCSAGTFVRLAEAVKAEKIPLKVHLSLHFTQDELRRKWMPRAMDIAPSINLLEFYSMYTGNPVEVHYTLIDGVNDSDEDACRLGMLLRGRGVDVKLLRFNPKAGEPYQPTPAEGVKIFEGMLGEGFGVVSECYNPPGTDIGASCGQFMMDYYVKYAQEGKVQSQPNLAEYIIEHPEIW